MRGELRVGVSTLALVAILAQGWAIGPGARWGKAAVQHPVPSVLLRIRDEVRPWVPCPDILAFLQGFSHLEG